MADVTLDSIRQQYPQYRGVPDDTLAQALHQKLYSSVPFQDFADRIGYHVPAGVGGNALGAAEVGGAGLLNMITAPVNAASDLVHRLGGNDSSEPLIPSVPVGQAGRNLIRGFQAPPNLSTDELRSGQAPGDEKLTDDQLRAKYEQEFKGDSLGQHVLPAENTVAGDVTRGALKVGGDVAALAPAGALLKNVAGRALGDTGEVIGSALRAPVGQIGDAVAETRAGHAASAANMAAANPQVDQALLDRTGFKTGTGGMGVAKAVAGEDAGPVLQTHNQAMGNTILSGEANVPAGTKLSYDAADAGQAGPGSVYNRVAGGLPEGQLDPDAQAGINSAGQPAGGRMSAGSPQAQTQIQALRDQLLDPKKSWNGQRIVNESRGLRQEGFKNIASDDVSNQELGRAQLDMARAIEGHIQRNLPQGGDVSWQQFTDARKALAKNYAVQGALRGSDVDLRAIGRLQRADPGLLDGGMKDVADFVNSREGNAVVGIPNSLNAPSFAGDALGAIDLHKPVEGAARFFGGVTARKALTGDTGAAVDAAAARYGAQPRRFDPLPGLTPPPGQAWRGPEQMALGDLGQGPGPSPFTTEEGANPNAPKPQARRGDVPLADVLSHGVEQRPPEGVSAGPMGAPQQEGLTFTGSPEAVGAKVRQGGAPRVAEATDDYGNRVALSKSNDPNAVWEEEQASGRMPLGERFAQPDEAPQRGAPTRPQEPGVQYQGRLENPPLLGREGGPAFARNFAPEDRAPQVGPGVPSGDIQRAGASRAGEAAQGGRPGLEDANVSRYGIRGNPEFPYEGPRPTGKPRWTGKGPEPEEPEPFDPSTPPKRPSGGGAGQMNREAILGDLMESWFNDRRNISDETPTVRANNGSSPGASGAGSLESINRGSKNLIETNGDNANPVARGVDQVDLAPKKGHVFVDASTGKLVDSGGMSPRQAQAVLNRFKARKTLADELEPVP